MIKDVMVRLDGTPADDVRLAAVGQIAEIFDSHITGLLFNALSPLVPDGSSGAGANEVTRLLDAARQAGHDIEATVFQRLAKLPYPVALRPNGRASEPDGLVENLLFGAGRHLFLVPEAGSRHARLRKPSPICLRQGRSAFLSSKVRVQQKRRR
jgi:hypothetical protein